jgi:hypothetical protein
MRTAVYDEDAVELYDDGILIETRYVGDKSIYWIEDMIENWHSGLINAALAQ